MNTLNIANKYYKEILRSKLTFVLLFAMPFFFLAIFSAVFGTSASATTPITYGISIVNDDTGIPAVMEDTLTNQFGIVSDGFGEDLISILTSLQYTDEQPIFDISVDNLNTAESLLDEQDINGIVVIPQDFSLAQISRINLVYGNLSIPGLPTDVNSTVTVIVNSNDFNGPVVESIVSDLVAEFTRGIDSGVVPDQIAIEENSIIQFEEFSPFDFLAPGTFILGSLLSATVFAGILFKDWESGAITRIRMSPIKPWEYLLGYSAIIFVFMQLQNLFLFISARVLFGFNPAASGVYGYFILLVTSFATLGLIFSIASLARNAGQSGIMLGFGTTLIAFLADAFFPMPAISIIPDIFSFTSGSPDLLLWDILPWTHAVNALRGLFLFNLSIPEVGGDVVLLVVLSLLWFVLGMYAFATKRLQRGTKL